MERQTIILQVVVTLREKVASGVFIRTKLVTIVALSQVQRAIKKEEKRPR